LPTHPLLSPIPVHPPLHSFPTRRSSDLGFIDRLPHALVAAFRATLEEVADADLLLHVVDASREDYEAQMDAVHGVLREVDADSVDRKSTRLNSSHVKSSYAVFCLKKKTG